MKYIMFTLKKIIKSIVFPLLLVILIFTLLDFTAGVLIYNSNIGNALYRTHYDRNYYNVLESFNTSSIFVFFASLSFAVCLQKVFVVSDEKRIQINIQNNFYNTSILSSRSRKYTKILVQLRI